MSLAIEHYRQGAWQTMGELAAGSLPGSISHNPPEGARELIVFACHGDHSTIERSLSGVDVDGGGLLRGVLGWGSYETVARLGAGEELELLLIPDGVTRAQRIRFRQATS